MRRVVVVGAGLAGLSAVRALREQGYADTIGVIGAEAHAPYDRPPLSKEFLLDEPVAGGSPLDGVRLEAPEALTGLDVEWRLGRSAVGLDAAGGRVVLDDGSSLPADGVVVATGSRARRLPELAGVTNAHALRTLEDAVIVRAGLHRTRAAGGEVLVLGGGFVGAEVASSAASLGLGVTVVELEPVLLRRQFGTALGEVWRLLHEKRGVRVHTGVRVTRWLSEQDGSGRRVRGAVLSDGTTLPADLVLQAVGSEPAVEWLQGSGVELDRGLVCDPVGRTRLPQVVGAGDVVRARHPFVGAELRIEHWTHALHQPAVAVSALLGGTPAPLAAAPYVWSDQHGTRIQFAGHREEGDAMRVVAGDLDSLCFTAVFDRVDRSQVSHQADDASSTQRPVAVLSVGQPREFARWRRMLPR